jgi:Pyruvate-formate lyase
MPSPRVKRFMEEHVTKVFCKDGYVNDVYLSILRSRVMTEVWKETEGEWNTLRKAKAIAKYLDTMPLFIRPDDTIVGFYAEDPHALPISIEASSTLLLRSMIMSDMVKPEEKEEFMGYADYWEKRNMNYQIRALLTTEEIEYGRSDRGYGEFAGDDYTSRAQAEYELVLENGIEGILNRLKKKYAEVMEARETETSGPKNIELNKQRLDIEAMIMSAEAIIRFANRYSELAKDMAEKEKDSARKKELLEISERCSYVPRYPARNFKDAVQSYWLCFQVVHMIEYLSHGTSQRLDQTFVKWYNKSVLKEKSLSRDEALEVMEELLLKLDEMGRPLPELQRKILQGTNFMATYTIGGQNIDGTDACNETTLLILDALADMRISHPDFKFRWHPDVDEKIYSRALEVLSLGIGQPSIKNDNVVIKGLMEHFGYTLEEARSWAVVGCISPAPTLNWGRARRDAWSVAPAKLLELTFFNGIDPLTGFDFGLHTGNPTNFKTFDEFFDAYTKQFALVMRRTARVKSISTEVENSICKRPCLSLFFERSLEEGRDIMDATDRSMPWVNVPGIVDSVDSLVGLKYLVYDNKKYTMDQVCTALKANWEGYEEMRQDFVNAPKYGNNDDYADEIAIKLYTMVADEMSKVTDAHGQSPMSSGLIVTFMFALAPRTGALTNGRKKGDSLADGGISPAAGMDKKGPMNAVLSAAKIDATKQKANIFNQKLTPNCIQGSAGHKKFQDYVTSIMDLGLDMVQFNFINKDTLLAAKAHPEKHKDLVVRISGYNAKFVELDEFVQDAVISRTQHAI